MKADIVELDVAAPDGRGLARAALDLAGRLVVGLEGDSAAVPDEASVRADLAYPYHQHVVLVALQGGEVVGFALLRLTLLEDMGAAWLQFGVDPSFRGRGVGDALLRAAGDAASAHGRTVVEWTSSRPAAAATEGPDERFARRRGGRPVQHVLRGVARLPLDPAPRAEVAAEVAAHAGGYDVVTWRGAVPGQWLDDRALLARRMSTEAPAGERDGGEVAWDGERVRASEARHQARGTTVAAAALDRSTGRMVGLSEVLLPHTNSRVAAQGDTLVLREHRGRRLGLAVKLAVLDELARNHSAVRYVVTYNAAENAPMLAVNAALGFAAESRVTLWNHDLPLPAPERLAL